MEDDFFNHRYFKLNKLFLFAYGSWPFENIKPAAAKAFLAFSVGLTILLIEIIRFIQIFPDALGVFPIIPTMVARIIIYVKWLNYFFRRKMARKLLLHIREDWLNILDEAEEKVMNEYGEIGRKITIFYACYMVITMILYIGLPFMPMFLDLVIPLNESRTRLLLFDFEHFLDKDDYYFTIMLHSSFITGLFVLFIICVDCMYMVYANHACAQFAVVCDRLENTMDTSYDEYTGRPKDAPDYVYENLVVSMKKHKRAIEFVSYVESNFTASMMFQVTVSIIMISVTGVFTLVSDDMETKFRYATYAVGQACHLFFLNHPGQRVMDHSGQVYQSAYLSYWYTCSLSSQKLVVLILLRSMTPCTFTAGKMVTLSMETFQAVIQTTMSYFTLLSSLD